ncbi:glycosyltransferase family protein [Limnobaculum parvum]|uniref:Glycosyltransferase n=1 Tax=Limnobaculum parvum TaxID=2172103 RepID=A0A2Y9U146_9GAMM|nr:glycosyltransferase family 4 protein [Limnobaculum parvum]AWH89665.1 hypothetical protein HYN51_14570 [Limnobaculum parvum]
MKIIFPVFGFGKSGGERVISKLATQLKNCGHDVIFIAPEHNAKPYYPTSADIVKVKRETRYIKIICSVINFYRILRVCKAIKPDCAIASFHPTAFLVFLLPSKLKKFYYIQAYEVVFYKQLWRRAIVYLSYILPLRKIVNSAQLLPRSINNFDGIVSAGVDTDLFRQRINENEGRKKTVGLVGRKEAHKGTNEVIDILISGSFSSQFNINIAVYLSEENKIKLDKNNMSYTYIDINSDEELANFYRMNDIMLAVGLVEDGAFHYPCAEAMASGCLVISNYAPLVGTNSKLVLTTFGAHYIFDSLNTALELSDVEINHEIERNLKIIKKISWDIVGIEFNNILTKNN